MKKILVSLVIVVLLAPFSFAKGGSGGEPPTTPSPEESTPPEETPAPPPPEDASPPPAGEPAPAPDETSSPAEETSPPTPEADTPPPVESPAPEPEANTPPPEDHSSTSTNNNPNPPTDPALPPPLPPESKPQPNPSPTEEPRHCGLFDTLEKRVNCRMEAKAKDNEEKLQIEAREAYFPEGCRWSTEEWQEKCKTRYQTIFSCYETGHGTGDQYDGKGVMNCIRGRMGLPVVLKPITEYCQQFPSASCETDYRNAVYHHIVARFYDAEERGEWLFKQGRLTQEDTTAFIIFISQSKIDFYKAQTKAERKDIIQKILEEWRELIKKVKTS